MSTPQESPRLAIDQIFAERGDFRQQVEAVQRVLGYMQNDLDKGVELSHDGDTWTWYPSAGDVIDAVQNAIANPGDVSTWSR